MSESSIKLTTLDYWILLNTTGYYSLYLYITYN